MAKKKSGTVKVTRSAKSLGKTKEKINLSDPAKPTVERVDTVRARKKKGLIIVHTGNGKGKSSSAFGMALRSAIYGYKIGVVQFIKGKWKTAEQKLPDLFPGQIDWFVMGEGFTWVTKSRARDVKAATEAWNRARGMILSGKYRMIILDEINYALKYEFIPVSDVVETLKMKSESLHVVLTGRDAPKELIAVADLVTEMKEIRHPYREQGVVAQKGVEF